MSEGRDPVDLIDRIHTLTLAHQHTLNGVTEAVKGIAHTLDGNGADGLKTRVALIEEATARLAEQIRRLDESVASKDSITKVRWEVVGMVVALAASMLSFSIMIWRT